MSDEVKIAADVEADDPEVRVQVFPGYPGGARFSLYQTDVDNRGEEFSHLVMLSGKQARELIRVLSEALE